MSDTSGGGGESFLTKAKNALNDLAEVKVVTAVGDLPVKISTKGDSTSTTLPDKVLDGDAIVTIVKLLDGDVTTVIGSDLLANAELRALHTAQVSASLAVLPTNLKALVDIAKSLLDQ
jgi:hypothetical protein